MTSKIITILKEELEIEKSRYLKNKFGKIAALGIYYLLITYVPIVLQYLLPKLLQKVAPETAFAILFTGAMIATTVLFNLFMLFVYRLKIPFFQQYRVDPKKPWPWEEQPNQWNSILKRSLLLNFINLSTFTVLTFADCKMNLIYNLDMSQTPSFLQTIKYLAFMYVLEDFFFFSVHKALHTTFLYKHVHKVHHQYSTTISIAGLHTHLVEGLLSNGIPTRIYMGLACILFGPVHVTTAIIWIILRMYDAENGHSGYIFSWTPIQVLPFCANDDFHDFHHSHNCGNFSSQLRIWDIFFGTNRNFKDYKQKQLKQKTK